MKIIIYTFIFLILIVGASYFVRNDNIPVFSRIGQDVSHKILNQSTEINYIEDLPENEIDIERQNADSPVVTENSLLSCGENGYGDDFISNLKSCTPYQCSFAHPFSPSKLFVREVIGFNNNGECVYQEEMPANQSMSCEFSESERVGMSEFYYALSQGQTVSSSFDTTFDENGGTGSLTTTIDGEVAKGFTLQDALDSGVCSISLSA